MTRSGTRLLIGAGVAALAALAGGPAILVVDAATLPTPTVSVAAAPSLLVYGQPLSLTGVVIKTSVIGSLAGETLTFANGTCSAVIATATLSMVSTTVAKTSITYPSGNEPLWQAGTDLSVIACYPGDAANAKAQSPAQPVTVDQAPTTLGEPSSSTGGLSSVGQSVIFTATVTHSGGGLPTGAVEYSVDGKAAASESLDGSGQAHWSTSSLTVGTHTVTASYEGDGNFEESAVSPGVTQTVTSPTPAPTPRPTATPAPTPTATPTPTPRATPAPTAVVVPAAAIIPNRPSGLPPGTPLQPTELDTSAVPPINLISLVSGIHMGSAPQIIVFLILLNVLVLGGIVVAVRRGRDLTRRSLGMDG
jgi:hypothetical protein